MKKIVYIAGTVHSGTTLLGMTLASSGNAIHFGEVFKLLQKSLEHNLSQYCTTGVLAKDCEFWSTTLHEVDRLGKFASLEIKYRTFLNAVSKHFGNDTIVIDSSKDPKYLKLLVNILGKESVTVIHFTKDVRAYTESMLKKREKIPSWERSKMQYFGLGIEEQFLKWYKVNKKVEDTIKLLNLGNVITLSYELFCLRSTYATNLINQIFGKALIDPSVPPRLCRDFTIAGNRMRENPLKLAEVSYDLRWLESFRWYRAYFFLRKIRKYNESIYYRHLSNDIFKTD